jgi:hypothetical protein
MGNLFPLKVAEKPGEILTLDLVSGFPKPFDTDLVLVIVDKFTFYPNLHIWRRKRLLRKFGKIPRNGFTQNLKPH